MSSSDFWSYRWHIGAYLPQWWSLLYKIILYQKRLFKIVHAGLSPGGDLLLAAVIRPLQTCHDIGYPGDEKRSRLSKEGAEGENYSSSLPGFGPQAKDQIKLLPTQEIGKIAAPMPMIAPLHLPSPELSFTGTSLKSTVMVEFSLQIIEELLLLCFRGPQVRCSELKH